MRSCFLVLCYDVPLQCHGPSQTGGRESSYCEYELGLDSKNMLTGAKLTFYNNGGTFVDNCYGDMGLMLTTSDNVYNFPTFNGQVRYQNYSG